MKIQKLKFNLKKPQASAIFMTIVLLCLLERCRITALPFLYGKYIYWLFAIVIGGIYFLLQNKPKKYTVNKFDIYILILFGLGLSNFNYISHATLFNVNTWYFFGYLLLYIVLRQILIEKEAIYKALNCIQYFLIWSSFINGVIAILQESNFLASENEFFKNNGLFYSPNQLALLLTLGFISTFALIKKSRSFYFKIFLYICQIILIYALFLSKCRGAYLALGIVFLFYVFNRTKENKTIANWKMLLFSGVFLFASFLLLKQIGAKKEESALGRIFILKTASKQIANNKLFGNGFDSFSLQYNLAKSKYFENERSWNETKNASYIYNASNDFLELAFDLGIIWIMFFIIFIFKIFCISEDRNKVEYNYSVIICLVIFSLTNTVLPVPLFIIIGCFFSVSLINLSDIKPIYMIQNRIILKIGFVIILLLALAVMILRINAEYRLFQIYNRTAQFSNSKIIESYASKIDAKGEANFMTGIIFLKNNNIEKGIDYLIKGFKQSGKPSLGKNLARFFERMGKYNEAEKIYIYNKNVEPFRFDARMDLFNLYIKTNQKEKAGKTAKEIYDLPIKIPSKKIDLFKEKAKSHLEDEQKKAV